MYLLTLLLLSRQISNNIHFCLGGFRILRPFLFYNFFSFSEYVMSTHLIKQMQQILS